MLRGGLWISPEGEKIEVQEHLIAIQHYPSLFGLSAKDVQGASIKDLRDIAVVMIKDGWIRYRDFAPLYAFEVKEINPFFLRTIEDILVEIKAQPKEQVSVSVIKGKKEYQGTVEEFFERKMFKYMSNPRNKWRLS